MDSVNIAFETVSPEKVFSYFLHTDEFVVTTQGSLMTNSPAVLDTMKAHMAIMKKQTIKPVSEKIFVINKDAVVIST
jgi:hypothetical protein